MEIKRLDEMRDIKGTLTAYQAPTWGKSVWQLVNTLVPYVTLLGLAMRSLSYSVWIAIPLIMLASGFFIRLFIIFHDCGHHSFFTNRLANEIVGIITGFLTFFPFYKWRFEHAVHHANSSNLDGRGTGDVWLLTVNEYRTLPWAKRFVYRLYRHPLVLFGMGPVYLFISGRRNRKHARTKERWYIYGSNVVQLLTIVGLCKLFGWQTVLLVQGVTMYLAGIVGVWLFYVQHQFEGSYFEERGDWDYLSAALKGSSFYQLPNILQWFTGNIGFHHIHHLNPKIPNYHLHKAYLNEASLQGVPIIGLRQSLKFLRYRLWDEKNKRFVGFDILDS